MLVAGGTGGLGGAVSLAFLQEDAKVVVTYRKQEEFDALKSAAGAGGSRLEGHGVDVTDEAAVRQLIDNILAKRGRLDALDTGEPASSAHRRQRPSEKAITRPSGRQSTESVSRVVSK